MGLHWNWNEKVGKCFMQGYAEGKKSVDIELNLYRGNAYIIAIQEHEDDTYNLAWFASDKNHLKNLLGLTKGFDNCMKNWEIKQIQLNTAAFPKAAEMADLFIKAKMDTEFILYREEEKK